MHGSEQTRPADDRRAQRVSVESAEPVINVMTGQAMGRIGNISRSGLMLIGPVKPDSNAVYQCMLALPRGDDGALNLEVGLQEQWHEQAPSTEQYWAGYRIVAITEADHAALSAWLEQSA